MIDNQNKKFNNKYLIKSARLENYDYGSDGGYFVTICTKDREHFFGEIVNGKMQLSEIGKIANGCWNEIPNHFPFVNLGEFVVMPNHLHGIVIINKNMIGIDDIDGVDGNGGVDIETQDFASLHRRNGNKNRFGPQSKNLASIIRGFKIGVTKYARQNTEIYNVWQPRFHDRIIRNENEFNNCTEYILGNPKKWDFDKLNQLEIKNNLINPVQTQNLASQQISRSENFCVSTNNSKLNQRKS